MTIASLINLSLAAVLGIAIGFERQWNQGMAGLRTNALVAFGAACFAVLGIDQVKAQIVSGIGFLGAGVIFREGPSVRGLNTAATLWCSAAAGALSGSGLYPEAVYCGAGVVAINLGLRWVQVLIHRYAPHPIDVETSYQIEVVCDVAEEANIRALLLGSTLKTGLGLKLLHSDKVGDLDGAVRVAAELAAHLRLDHAVEEVVGRIGLEQGVVSARWSVLSAHASVTVS